MRVTQWCQPAQVILFDEGGFLYARAPEDNIDLQGLLTQALPRFGGQGAGGSTMVRRSAALPPLVKTQHAAHVPRAQQTKTRVALLAACSCESRVLRYLGAFRRSPIPGPASHATQPEAVLNDRR